MNRSSERKSRSIAGGAGGRVFMQWDGRRRRARSAPSSDYLHPFSRAVARTIRWWRLAHELSGYEVAKRAKVSRGTLAGVERGEAWYSINVAARICDAMGLDPGFAVFHALRSIGRLPRGKRSVYCQ